MVSSSPPPPARVFWEAGDTNPPVSRHKSPSDWRLLALQMQARVPRQQESGKGGQSRAEKHDMTALTEFATRYAAAWSSQDPVACAAFYAENASFRINDGAPSIGRPAIEETACRFMTAFPDMVVRLILENTQKRATVYFDPALHRALRLKAADTDRSMSDLIIFDSNDKKATLTVPREYLQSDDFCIEEDNLEQTEFWDQFLAGTQRLYVEVRPQLSASEM